MLPLVLLISLDWRAEFFGHTVPQGGTTYDAPDHIVVEVEVTPDKSAPIRLSNGMFRLRLNGKKELASDTPGMVASSLKYEEQMRGVQMRAQAGPVVLGERRRPDARFPGDPNDGPQAKPAPGTEGQLTDAEAVMAAALPEGSTLGPTKGLVYFPYRGKVKSLKSVEILWGERTLKLK